MDLFRGHVSSGAQCFKKSKIYSFIAYEKFLLASVRHYYSCFTQIEPRRVQLSKVFVYLPSNKLRKNLLLRIRHHIAPILMVFFFFYEQQFDENNV